MALYDLYFADMRMLKFKKYTIRVVKGYDEFPIFMRVRISGCGLYRRKQIQKNIGGG
jgi:hypothetical protein